MFEMQKVHTDIQIQGFHSIYYFEFGKDFSHTPEKHNFWEMVYVDSGKVNAITNGVGCTLEEGQAIFHEPGDVHAHVSNHQVANNMLVISFSADGELLRVLAGKSFTLNKTGKTLLSLFLEEAKNALRIIPSDYDDRKNLQFLNEVFGSSQLLSCYFTEFLIQLIRNSSSIGETLRITKQSRDIANNSISELIADYLKNNLYTSISLKEVCEHFLIGKTQLCKIFRDSMGQSPMEYYRKLKISEAKKMLREKNNSVSQISELLGYSSVHIFSRAFKSVVGVSPTVYIRRIL